MKRAIKVRLYPTVEQAEFLNAQFGAVRCVFNKALHISRHMYQRHGVSLNPKPRKKKGSANRAKARLQVARCHEHVANARADFQHKLSRTLINENQATIVEMLKTANMMKNHRLARAIGDAGWHSFISRLEYKAEQKGVYVVKLDQWYASFRRCHCCGCKMSEMP